MELRTSKEERSFIELLETTIPVPQKLAAMLGRDNYLAFIRLIDGWKKRITNTYRSVWNYDGKALGLFIKHTFAIIKQYHFLAIARYGENVNNSAELLTKLSASVQSLFISQISSDLEFVPVKYSDLSEETVVNPETLAYNVLFSENKKQRKLSLSNKSMAGFIYYSMIYHMIDILSFAYFWLKKSLYYHMQKYYSDDLDYHAELLLYFDKKKVHSSTEESEEKLLEALFNAGE